MSRNALDLWLEARPEAVGTARHALDELSGALAPEVLSDVQLMVSELVTNCVRHANLSETDRIGIRVALSPETVLVEVTNRGHGFDPPSEDPSIYEPSGWGLFLVGHLSDRWGVEGAGGTRVWFEVSRRRPAEPKHGPGEDARNHASGPPARI